MAEFERLFTGAVLRSTRVSATRLDLVLTAAAESAARDLAAREVVCCSFFAFEFDSAGSDIVMGLEVTPSHTEVLDALAERVGAILAARTAP
ncbi:hypothetical protein [Mycolicibacterium sp.]|uniref:hypothetical protein n=1 Tax=Mycolicibacterium sp. TaxID=2320850 RepID=UPI0037CB3E5D